MVDSEKEFLKFFKCNESKLRSSQANKDYN